LDLHAPWARTWALSRDRRQTRWTSPGGTVRIETTLTPHEYKVSPGDAAGMIGESLVWPEEVQHCRDGVWIARPILVRVRKAPQKPKALARGGRR
jgi:hypothetical protein